MFVSDDCIKRMNQNAKRIIERQKAQERYERRAASKSEPKRGAVIVPFPKR